MESNVAEQQKLYVPIWEKVNLTLPEAAKLFNIGINEIRSRTDEPGCDFVLFKGTHRLIKRKKFEEYVSNLQVW